MKCIYCGKSAGLFSRKHNECEQKHNDTIQELRNKVGNYNLAELEQFATEGFVKPQELRSIIMDGFLALLNQHMLDHFVAYQEEKEAEAYMENIISLTKIWPLFGVVFVPICDYLRPIRNRSSICRAPYLTRCSFMGKMLLIPLNFEVSGAFLWKNAPNREECTHFYKNLVI